MLMGPGFGGRGRGFIQSSFFIYLIDLLVISFRCLLFAD
jgi:hypothetical protein